MDDDDDIYSYNISLVKNKSDFIPPKNRNAALERYIENVKNTPNY